MKSLEELSKIREEAKSKMGIREGSKDIRIVVGMATCGISAGARPVLKALVEELKVRNLKNVSVSQTGCIGICRFEPIIEVFEPGKDKVTYIEMTSEKAKKIISEHIVNGNVINDYTIGSVSGKYSSHGTVEDC